MNVNEIPRELYNKIQLAFEADNNVRLLRTAQQNAQRKGDYNRALTIAQNIDNLWTICLDNYIRKAESQVQSIDTKTMNMPEKDREGMMERLIVLFMCCDIIESALVDVNDILHKYYADVNITTFDDLRQTLDLSKSKLKYLQETGDYMKDLAWGDKCDNMYELMRNKARSIARKRKESKNWGENAMRLINQ